MNKESNGYIIGFSIVLVLVVGTLLTFIAMTLQPYQEANKKNEKMQNIVQSLSVDDTVRELERNNAGDEFPKYVKQRIILNYEGVPQGEPYPKKEGDEIDSDDDKDPFNVDLVEEYKTIKDIKKRNYPLYIADYNGKTVYVAPVYGKGLWAGIWGYIGFDENFVVQGAVFDHESETPGLGAEINKDFFETQFIGKKFVKADGEYTRIKVQKPGGDLNDHTVDGISGGTFTSKGVEEMMERSLAPYVNYVNSLKAG